MVLLSSFVGPILKIPSSVIVKFLAGVFGEGVSLELLVGSMGRKMELTERRG